MNVYRGALTEAFFKSSKLAFFPASRGEARYIQKRLFELGAAWVNTGRTISSVDGCVDFGILSDKGTLYTFADDTMTKAIVCDVRCLSPHSLPSDSLLEERLAALEKQVGELNALLKPATLGKSGLVVKKGAS